MLEIRRPSDQVLEIVMPREGGCGLVFMWGFLAVFSSFALAIGVWGIPFLIFVAGFVILHARDRREVAKRGRILRFDARSGDVLADDAKLFDIDAIHGVLLVKNVNEVGTFYKQYLVRDGEEWFVVKTRDREDALRVAEAVSEILGTPLRKIRRRRSDVWEFGDLFGAKDDEFPDSW